MNPQAFRIYAGHLFRDDVGRVEATTLQPISAPPFPAGQHPQHPILDDNEENGMPARRELTMRQLRQMLRLAREGVSAREIGRTLGVARSTVQDNLKRAEAAGLRFPGYVGPALVAVHCYYAHSTWYTRVGLLRSVDPAPILLLGRRSLDHRTNPGLALGRAATSRHAASRMASTVAVLRRRKESAAVGGNVLVMAGAEAEEVAEFVVARQNRAADRGHLKPRMGR